MITTQANIMTDLLIQIASTVIGGIILALIFFLVKDRLFGLPGLSGLWTFQVTTETTSYNPFKNMSLTYLVLLIQEGNHLSGTGEKIKEVMATGTREFVG